MGLFEKPAKPKPMDSPSRRETMVEQSREAIRRAERRFKIAAFASRSPGSLRAKRQYIIAALESGLIAPGPIPAPSTIRDLQNRWAAGQRSVVDYTESPRSGRPRKPLTEPFRSHIRQALDEADDKSARALHRECKQIARARGFKAPTLHQVTEAVKAAYRLKRATSRHGSRAGEIDGLPHGRIATRHVHDVWCLDELTLPVWARVPDCTTGIWVSVLCDIVLIVDVRSTAVVGWHIVDPEGRVDADGQQMWGAAREEDVFAALLTAACPELAPESTADFAGYLPAILRWDNHKAHKALAARLEEAEVGIEPFFIRKRRAISNGSVENRVGTLKRWTKGLKGHIDRYLPTDQVKNESAAEQSRARTALAGSTGDRRTERLPIDPRDLMDVQELRDAFNAIVRRYNHEHVNRVFRQTAAQRFFRYLAPRHPRKGRDLLGLIEPQETTVGKNGVIHYQDDRQWEFEGIIGDAILMLDSTVIYRPDPLMRCIWVEREGKHHVLTPTPGVAERAREIARNQIAIARRLSDTAKLAREARYVAELGEERREWAEEEYQRQRQIYREGKAEAPAPQPEVESLKRMPDPTAADEIDPYSDDNINTFVRFRGVNGEED